MFNSLDCGQTMNGSRGYESYQNIEILCSVECTSFMELLSYGESLDLV